jgi:hypothetical protein
VSRDFACVIRCEFATDTLAPSYLCIGSCGERVVFGVIVVLTDALVPAMACPRFRDEILRVFGRGGPRRFDEATHDVLPMEPWPCEPDAAGARHRMRLPPAPPEPQEGIGFQGPLGRSPRSRVQDPEQLAAFERMRRGDR